MHKGPTQHANKDPLAVITIEMFVFLINQFNDFAFLQANFCIRLKQLLEINMWVRFPNENVQ